MLGNHHYGERDGGVAGIIIPVRARARIGLSLRVCTRGQSLSALTRARALSEIGVIIV